MATKKDKPFTWADLKKAVNRIPDKHLKKEVRIWTDAETFYSLAEVSICEEDYLFDGDEGCCPRSQMKEAIEENKKLPKDQQEDFYVAHEKGTRILFAEE